MANGFLEISAPALPKKFVAQEMRISENSLNAPSHQPSR